MDLAQQGINLLGRRFGMLVVTEEVKTPPRVNYKWKCKCDCGNDYFSTTHKLMYGEVKSCGCNHREWCVTHGHSDDRLYSVWQTMKRRCLNPKNRKYKNYGGRGITICDEWLNSFQSFYNWAIANGYDYDAPFGRCTLDRIDVNGNYEPSNCRWTDLQTQAFNKQDPLQALRGIEVDYNGKHYLSISELAREYGFNNGKLYRRIGKMSIEDAMTEILKGDV